MWAASGLLDVAGCGCSYAGSLLPFMLDLYAEKHAKEAMSRGGGLGEENEVRVQTHAGALYNPDIPVDRPQVMYK